jgi:TolB-like protein
LSLFNELKRRNVFRVGIAYGVSAWVLLQFADLVLDNIAAPAWVMRVLMLVVALGFVISLVVAWAYELTPEGIRRESDVDRVQSITHQTARKLHFVTLGAIVLLIALLLADRFMPVGDDEVANVRAVSTTESAVEAAEPETTAPTPLGRGVAVLPFANLSEDPNNAFFAGGVHEDILTNLSRIAGLRVISRTSMVKISEQGLDIREIGLLLNVSHVLEGSVRRAGNQVRVTVQLIDASNDDHIWADNYDRQLDDIFSIQSEIAQKIAAQLKTELSPEQAMRIAEVPTQNTQAYDLYLKARELTRTWITAEAYNQMRLLLEQAVALDPKFMDAKVMLAMVYGRLLWWDADPDGVYREKAKIMTDQISQQWPGRPETDVAVGNYHYTVERDYQKALFSYQRALPFMPNDTDLLTQIAAAYKRLEQFDLGLPVITLAESLDPEHSGIVSERILHLVGTGRYEEAMAHARARSARFPDDIANQSDLAWLSLYLFGNKSEYLRIMGSMKQTNPLLVVSDPLAQRMLSNAAELDQQIGRINQFRSEADFLTATKLGIQIAELLNLAGREEESRQMARTTLESIEDRLAKNLPLGGNSPELHYPQFAYLACLAGDEAAFRRYTAITDSISLISPENRYAKQQLLALAMAECGDVNALWETAKDQADNPIFGVTRWQLALDPLYQHYLANIPEYQEMVRTLQSNQ